MLYKQKNIGENMYFFYKIEDTFMKYEETE